MYIQILNDTVAQGILTSCFQQYSALPPEKIAALTQELDDEMRYKLFASILVPYFDAALSAHRETGEILRGATLQLEKILGEKNFADVRGALAAAEQSLKNLEWDYAQVQAACFQLGIK